MLVSNWNLIINQTNKVSNSCPSSLGSNYNFSNLPYYSIAQRKYTTCQLSLNGASSSLVEFLWAHNTTSFIVMTTKRDHTSFPHSLGMVTLISKMLIQKGEHKNDYYWTKGQASSGGKNYNIKRRPINQSISLIPLCQIHEQVIKWWMSLKYKKRIADTMVHWCIPGFN